MRERRHGSAGLLGAGVALLVLGGCAQTERAGEVVANRLIGPAKPDAARVLAPSGSAMAREGQRIERGANRRMAGMIEAPELFSDTRELVWSGGETLGGLWIGHGGIDRAYRVRAVNLRTNIVVDGALLPRYGTSDSVVISAEAARALGMLANRPEEIALVAILPAPLDPPEIQVAEVAGNTGEPLAEAELAEAPSADGPTVDIAALGGTTLFGEAPDNQDVPVTASKPAAIQPAAPASPGVAAPSTTRPEPIQAAATRPAAERVAEPAAEPRAETEAVATAPAAETARTTTAPAEPDPVTTAARSPAGGTAADPAPSASEDVDAKPFVISGNLKTGSLAADLVRTLSAYGVEARTTAVQTDGDERFRVIAGPFRSSESRQRALDLFRAIGVYGARASAG